MCGRFAMDDTVNELITEFVESTGLSPEDWRADWKPSYNIRPTDPVPILLETLTDRRDPTSETVRRAELAQWWLTPSFSKELRSRNPLFNARSETVTEKASFREPVKRQRAIIPAIGYYETHTEGSTKVPYFIHPPEGLLLFAGLYSWWADPTLAPDNPLRWHLTTTILTREAVGDVAWIHDRTPVTIPRDQLETWVDPATLGDRAFVEAMVDAATPVAESLQFHRIASPIRGDSVEMIQPV
ncbi:putative SOS response-associated peptidase YedK [Microbacteriaceae bacterium SG_E_30_P1]|uniref:Abasic site processing protein n=1 Tax=Antiquaquibacter oligotrophicus TaxID=2880260 RepID=A0ABT6KMF6_9MICO|nr:SOS response-associated peptidase [Antiquaquibacter oligotrophicus]MDH6181175.1 putative SOS response-associated peptidase YedK [Antiquaquibacter oligotrophicus]UDF13130.1 SOS response-associated peptidase [Antiquaquibacter oligotrophicus]